MFFFKDYANEVRVVSIGSPVDELLNADMTGNDQHSVELCGGMYVTKHV